MNVYMSVRATDIYIVSEKNDLIRKVNYSSNLNLILNLNQKLFPASKFWRIIRPGFYSTFLP